MKYQSVILVQIKQSTVLQTNRKSHANNRMATVAPATPPIEKPCRRRAALPKHATTTVDTDTKENDDALSTKAITHEHQAIRAKKEAVPNNATVSTNNRASVENDRSMANFVEDEPHQVHFANETEEDTTSAPSKETPIASVGDPSLPHILSIGPQGIAEIFELAKSVFTSARGTNVHSLGMSIKELANLYGVRTTEQIKAMQTAFGVKTRGATPPIDAYLQQKCQFKGFGMVKSALQKRLTTIQETQKLHSNTYGQRRLGLQTRWIEETLRKMSLATKACPSGTAVSSETQTNSSFGTGVCPCLNDMKFLRYMMYLMLLLQGHANEDVKRHIQQIPLSKILASVEKGDLSNATAEIQEAINLLSTLLQTKTQNQTRELQEALVQIHMKLRNGQPVPADISLQTILTLLDQDLRQIEDLQTSATQVAELSKRLEKITGELDDANAELAAKKDRIDELQKQLSASANAASAAKNSADTELAAKKETITTQASELAAKGAEIETLRRAKATLEQSLAEALRDEETVRATITDLQAEQTRLSGELTAAREQLAQKQGEIDRLNEQLRTANETIRTQTEQIAILTGEVETTRAALEQTQKSLEDCNATHVRDQQQHSAAIADLEQRRAAAEAARAQIQSQLDTATGQKGQLQTELDAANVRIAALGNDLTALQSSGTARDEEYRRTREGLEAEIARLTGETGTLRDQLATEQAGRVQNAVTIRGLESNLAQAQRNIQGLQTNLAGAQETIQQKDSEIETLIAAKAETEAQAAAAKADSEAAIQAATDAAATKEAENEQAKSDLLAQIQQLEGRAKRAEESLIAAAKESTDKAAETNRRLETLLSILALDPEMLTRARDYMSSGNESITGTLQKELCDFFRYFYDLTGIQMRRIHSLKFAPGNPDLDRAIKDDIFRIFPEIPATDSKELLRDISLIFQDIFTKGYMSGIPGEVRIPAKLSALALAIGNYPTQGGNPLAQGVSPLVIQSIIAGGGLLQTTGVQPIGDSTFKVRNENAPNEFTQSNTMNYTPLMILGIKFVQLVYEQLHEKYSDLASRCGLGDLSEARSQTDAALDAEAARLAAEEAARRKKAEEDAEAAVTKKIETTFETLCKKPDSQKTDTERAVCNYMLGKATYTDKLYDEHIKTYTDLVRKNPKNEYYKVYLQILKDEKISKKITKETKQSEIKQIITDTIKRFVNKGYISLE